MMDPNNFNDSLTFPLVLMVNIITAKYQRVSIAIENMFVSDVST